MKRINFLSNLLMEELSDLLNAENQWVEALPKMAEASQSSTLKSALKDYLEITREQVQQLQDIFSNTGQNPSNRICEAMQGFIAGIEDVVNDPEKYPARDAAIIKVAQQVENFEINGYVTAREHAADFGHTSIVELLTHTLNEERAMNFHLNELAQYMINAQATNPFDPPQQSPSKPKSGGFYMPKKSGGFYMPKGNMGKGRGRKKIKNTENQEKPS